MISDSQKNGYGPERGHLALDVIGPFDVSILGDTERLGDVFRLVENIFIKVGGQAQVAQVPVKRGLILSRRFRDRGHHHVAAIARVAGHQESPRAAVGLLSACRRRCQRDNKRQTKNHRTHGKHFANCHHPQSQSHSRMLPECHLEAQFNDKISLLTKVS